MIWSELYNSENEPSDSQIKEFICEPLFDALDNYLRLEHAVAPKLSYSKCAMDGGAWKGWNIKYQKSGKSLCTVYPKQGYFLALVPVSNKEMPEADLMISACSEYTRNIYANCEPWLHGKMLGLEVTNEKILDDIKNFVLLRVKNRRS